MKKIALGLVALVFVGSAFADDGLMTYSVSVKDKTNTLSTIVGKEAASSNITSRTVTNEVNSDFGKVMVVTAEKNSGTTVTVLPESVNADGTVITKFSYIVVNNGQEVEKGQHRVKLARGESVVLPGINESKVTLALR